MGRAVHAVLQAIDLGSQEGLETLARAQAACDAEASDAADWAEQQPDPIAEDALKNVFA